MIKSVQDLNACDQLERQMTSPYNLAMENIRKRRVGECHYINTQIDDTSAPIV